MLYRGIIVMIGSTVSILLAITWGGVQYPWTSARVLVPLVIGGVGIAVFFVLELFWLKGPTVSSYLSHRFRKLTRIRYHGTGFSSPIVPPSAGELSRAEHIPSIDIGWPP